MLGIIYPKLDILGQNSQNWCKNHKKLEKYLSYPQLFMHWCKIVQSGGS